MSELVRTEKEGRKEETTGVMRSRLMGVENEELRRKNGLVFLVGGIGASPKWIPPRFLSTRSKLAGNKVTASTTQTLFDVTI